MDPNRHRRGTAREPLWGSTRLLVLILILAVTLAVLVGVASTRARSRQPLAAAPSTATRSTPSLPASTTSVAPAASSTPSAASPSSRTLDLPATTSTAPSTLSSTTTTPKLPAKPNTPILQQRGLPPAGVDELLSPFTGGAGGDSCVTSGLTDADFRGPAMSLGPGDDPLKASSTETEIGTPLNICFHRFSEGGTISVKVVSPSGDAQRFTVCYNCTVVRPTSLLWYTVAGQPLGRYQVIATQETAKAIATIVVSPQSLRTVYVAGQDPSLGGTRVDPIGTEFQLSLTGYDPDQQVWLLVYRNPNPTSRGAGATYRTRVPLVMSGRGETLFNIRTGAGDPKGCYVFDTSPPAFRGTVQPVDWGNVFCIA